MFKLTAAQAQALIRADLAGFVQGCFYELHGGAAYLPNWHIEVICNALEAARRGETKRLIITVPPRSLKSICASIAFVAFLLGHKPTAQVICASYGQDLADKLARDCRTILNSAFYRRLFATQLDSLSVQELTTTAGGFRLATSVGGVLTGRGADYIIIDDAMKPDEALSDALRRSVNQWYDNTLVSRLNSKKDGVIIIIMQRLHQDDLVGHVLQHGGWHVINLPAIAEVPEDFLTRSICGEVRYHRSVGSVLHPEREPLEVLQKLRQEIGEYNFASQYQQNPAPLGGGMVKEEWFNRYNEDSRPTTFDCIIQSWDTANKSGELNDYSVCTTWGVRGSNIYLLHVLRRRMAYPDLKRAVIEQALAFKPSTILIEDKASGTQLIQDLIAGGLSHVQRYMGAGDKVMRLHAQTATIENGFVYVPVKAPWLAEYLAELTTFPNSKYKDQTDSTSQALDWIKVPTPALLEYYRREVEDRKRRNGLA